MNILKRETQYALGTIMEKQKIHISQIRDFISTQLLAVKQIK